MFNVIMEAFCKSLKFVIFPSLSITGEKDITRNTFVWYVDGKKIVKQIMYVIQTHVNDSESGTQALMIQIVEHMMKF